MRKPSLLTFLGVSLLCSAPAFAGSLYRWQLPDGSIAYTDDAKRIPEQYRASATAIPTRGLEGYARYTPAQQGAASQRQEVLTQHVERLRDFNEQSGDVYSGGGVGPLQGGLTTVNVNRDLAVTLPTPGEDQPPYVTEERRVRDRLGSATRHVTVVRQGDRVVGVYRGDNTESSSQWITEEQLLQEGGR